MSTNAKLYDGLDLLYRELWGRTLHHGLWIKGNESPVQARNNLAQVCLTALAPQKGDTIADIGCGYGTFSHLIVKDSDCQVHSITNSLAQIQAATSHPNITFHHTDWLDHSLPPRSLDKAIALESLSHFPNFDTFLSATSKSLRPGALFVISDWYAKPHPSPVEQLLLRNLAKTGAIPNWRPINHLLTAASRHHFTLQNQQNFSSQAAPTWNAFFKLSCLLPFQKPKLIPLLSKTALHRPPLLISFPLLRLAYHLGILEYHLCIFKKEPTT